MVRQHRRLNGHEFEQTLGNSRASQVVLVVKNSLANARDVRDAGSIPRSGRYPGEGHGNSLQYSCLENTMDRGTWWATSPQGHKEQDITEVTQHTMGDNERQGSLACCSPWDHRESDMTQQLNDNDINFTK